LPSQATKPSNGHSLFSLVVTAKIYITGE